MCIRDRGGSDTAGQVQSGCDKVGSGPHGVPRLTTNAHLLRHYNPNHDVVGYYGHYKEAVELFAE
ncbi:6-phospho-beta-glucosidase, partial [Escherichia coli]|nr:6-phospho-beta-glucosidase [Escherichia coli]